MKILKWILIVFIVLIGAAVIGFQIMKSNTKKHSPETEFVYNQNGMDVTIVYSRPFKKERKIFGELVPYGEVWRTGANEATTFVTKTNLMVGGELLPAGDYTLWTIPEKSSWEVIFNSGEYGWGVNFDAKAARDPALDVLNVTVPVQKTFKVVEQFTIEMDNEPTLLIFSWDDIVVQVPIEAAD
jgi:hypothetical protein